MSTGYSKRPLVAKLGIKAGNRIAILNAPEGYDATLGELPENVTVLHGLQPELDFIHFFTKAKAELTAQFPQLKDALQINGMLWISWPKKASKVPTDVNENVVREVGLAHGLVDVKVAAIDAIWSGLKFVYRLEDRK